MFKTRKEWINLCMNKGALASDVITILEDWGIYERRIDNEIEQLEDEIRALNRYIDDEVF